ncbi:MAG: hypothetical protein HQK96_07915 [Nitrospirae bacterium]|nr:hypothetical protein [Nitrospirota bacterium]
MKLTRGKFECLGCGEDFQAVYADDKPKVCPHCKSGNINCLCEEPARLEPIDAGQAANVGQGGCGCGCGHKR